MTKAISCAAFSILWLSLSGCLGLYSPIISPLLLPSPEAIMRALFGLKWTLLSYTLVTALRVIAGFLIGAFGGVGIALLILRSIRFAAFVWPLIEIIRPCPPIALIPFVILYFGLGLTGQLMLIALGTAIPFILIVVDGARQIELDQNLFFDSLGADFLSKVTWLYLPHLQPSFVTASRLCASSSIALTCAAEYLAAQGGLGFLIRNARSTLNTDVIVVACILLTTLSWTLDSIILWIGKKILFWSNLNGREKII